MIKKEQKRKINNNKRDRKGSLKRVKYNKVKFI
jgi:hypothetical protein